MDNENSFTVELINDGLLAVQNGQSILDASLAAGIPHYHACGGNARCSTCRVFVEEGEKFLTPPNQAELALARKMGFPVGVRLACQTRVNGGPIRLHRIIRDKTDVEMYVHGDFCDATRSLGEERELALFFLDIRNFTPFAQSHLPFDVIHVLNRFFALVRNIIHANNGRVIEVAGDGLYVVFGMESSIAEAAASAVRAGLHIIDDVEIFNDTYLEIHFSHRLAVGMGLHVGRVICGEVGIGVKGALSVIGYPVNVAARLEAATKQMNNSFLVSEEAFRLLAEPPANVASAEISLKGIPVPHRVFLLGRSYEFLNKTQ
ncbi:MAG: adenylate/guanylate cyclase domain-containing protein [candidate division KSB1 bacterium]|nr:adenylate/guanylate cyclase domain-containing protein [candidate division KSB1 bacterium]MDZ7367008.1 adenylate/guanylate cyclase domain-containing protein [candidate division KSB1 bacterium]